MNAREILLSWLAGSVVALLLLYGGVSTVMGWFNASAERLSTAERDLSKRQLELRKLQLASKQLRAYEERSLPSEVDVAQSLYQTWLLNATAAAQLSGANIAQAKPRVVQRTYQALAYTLAARGTWSQWLDWFHRFQKEDRLHRIDSFVIRSVEQSKELEAIVNVSALVVNSAPKGTTLPERIRSDMPDFNTLCLPVLQRNFFFPPNHAPECEVPSQQTAYVGRSWEFTLKGRDADPLDRLRFSLVQSDAPDLRFDAETGRASWSPREKGEFVLEFAVSDDGIPEQTSQKSMKLVVVDPPTPPPPPMVVKETPKLTFDLAKHTLFTAMIGVNDNREVWLHVRPSGEMKKLREGDAFEIGSIQGKVMAILDEEFVFECQGEIRKLAKGATLVEAVKMEAVVSPPEAAQ